MSKLIPLLETLFMNKGGSPDLWKAVIKVVNSKPEEAKYFASYVKMKLKDLNPEVQLLALDVVDYVMVEGKIPVWTQIAAKDFLTNLISILKTRDAPDVQVRILYLLKKWGQKYESYKEILPNFSEIYQGLKNSGVVFPDSYEAGYLKYISSNESYEQDYSNSYSNKKNEDNNYYSNDFSNNNYVEEIHNDQGGNYKNNIHLDINPSNYDKKYSKLLDKISVWIENINLANDMIDNTEVGSRVDDGLKSVIDNLRSGENELIVYIQEKVKNEKLLEILLGLNDDINRTITRYDVIRSKKKPEPFVSAFLEDKFSGSNSYRPKAAPKKNTNVSSSSNSGAVNTNKQNNNANLIDPLDLFGGGSTSNTNSANTFSNPNSNINPPKKVDDIFDIFNQPSIVQSSSGGDKNQNSMNNISNMNNMNNMDFFNNQNQGEKKGDQTFNFMNLSNPNQSNSNVSSMNTSTTQKKGVDLLSEQLKNAYSGKDESQMNSNKNTFDMSNMNNTLNQNMMGGGMNNNQMMGNNMGMGGYPMLGNYPMMGMGNNQMMAGNSNNNSMDVNQNQMMGNNQMMGYQGGIIPNYGYPQAGNANTNTSLQMNMNFNNNTSQQSKPNTGNNILF